MRLPRFRFTLRRMMVAVAIFALALFGHRLYREGVGTRWLLLKLHYGTVSTRRAAADEIRATGFGELARDVFGDGQPKSREELIERRDRRARQARLWLRGLVEATNDPDPVCRAKASNAISVLTIALGTEADRDLARRHLLVALKDPEDAVREAACEALSGLAGPGVGATFDALRGALDDPSASVRETAARSLAFVGLIHKEAQTAVAPILIRLLAGRDEARVRIAAAWGLCRFGKDAVRHPATSGPDVVPALVAATWSDPAVEVRRAVAAIFATLEFDSRTGPDFSAWETRKEAIIPALTALLGDEDEAATRRASPRRWFALGPPRSSHPRPDRAGRRLARSLPRPSIGEGRGAIAGGIATREDGSGRVQMIAEDSGGATTDEISHRLVVEPGESRRRENVAGKVPSRNPTGSALPPAGALPPMCATIRPPRTSSHQSGEGGAILSRRSGGENSRPGASRGGTSPAWWRCRPPGRPWISPTRPRRRRPSRPSAASLPSGGRDPRWPLRLDEQESYAFIPSEAEHRHWSGRPEAGQADEPGTPEIQGRLGRSWPSLPNHARVTIGTREEMAAFRSAMDRVMNA